jgi:hypothetical protein
MICQLAFCLDWSFLASRVAFDQASAVSEGVPGGLEFNVF